ncbi:MAG TPA: septum formation initiator family protein [Chitinophagales bacterium]|nr:septum formation initiator family protein [Chitinophagales bacterium]
MWKNFKKRVSKLPPFLKNPYFLCAMAFAIWMLFIDENNLFNQYRKHAELSALLEKKQYYLKQIDESDKAYKELTTNPETQEKFAREHYWMKKPNEDVFVIVKK